MTPESAIAFISALLVWVLIPGPAVMAIIGRSLTLGFSSALKLIGGILLGDLFYITLVLCGMAAMGKLLGSFFVVVRIIGALYLIYLGVMLWIKQPQDLSDSTAASKPDYYQSFLTGFSITLGNPKAILFHLGFLPTFFDLSAIHLKDAFLITLIFMTILGGSLSLYAYTAGKARMFFRDRTKRVFLNRFSGTMLIGAGIAAATKK